MTLSYKIGQKVNYKCYGELTHGTVDKISEPIYEVPLLEVGSLGMIRFIECEGTEFYEFNNMRGNTVAEVARRQFLKDDVVEILANDIYKVMPYMEPENDECYVLRGYRARVVSNNVIINFPWSCLRQKSEWPEGKVKELMEEGRKLREAFDKRLRAMRTPTPEMLATRCR